VHGQSGITGGTAHYIAYADNGFSNLAYRRDPAPLRGLTGIAYPLIDPTLRFASIQLVTYHVTPIACADFGGLEAYPGHHPHVLHPSTD
jgi:hypothetical protein